MNAKNRILSLLTVRSSFFLTVISAVALSFGGYTGSAQAVAFQNGSFEEGSDPGISTTSYAGSSNILAGQ